MSFKVFVSYSSKDEKRINPILETLGSITELSCYFFKETKEIAQNTRNDIVGHLRNSDACLAFHSAHSLRSSYVQNEIGAAIGLGKQVIICKLDQTKPEGMLQGENYVDLYDKEMCHKELDRLVAWIQERIAERQSRSPVKTVTEGDFNWVSFLLLVGIIAGSAYLISRTARIK